MLFKPEDLNYGSYDPIQEAADILNESVYLDESESILSPVAIPVVENARIGANVVAFADVERLAEDHGVDYIDAMIGIAEANQIDIDHLAVSVPEWKIIASPEVVNELNNVIVAPISSQNPIYQLCEACVDLALEEDNEAWIELFGDIIEEETKTASGIILPTGAKTAPKRGKGGKTLAELRAKFENSTQVQNANKVREDRAAGKGASIDDNQGYQARAAAAGLDTKAYQDLADGKAGAAERVEKNKAELKKKFEQEEKDRLANDMGIARGSESKDGVPEETKSLLEKVKSAAKWPIDKISAAIASLKKKYQEMKAKYQGIPQEKRTIWQKFMNLVMGAINRLSNLLSSKKSEGAA